MKKIRGGGAFKEAFTFGLGAGMGAAVSTMMFIVIGLIFFIPGIMLLSKEKKKPKDQQSKGTIITAYILMFIGAIIGLGIGMSFIFSNLMEEF